MILLLQCMTPVLALRDTVNLRSVLVVLRHKWTVAAAASVEFDPGQGHNSKRST